MYLFYRYKRNEYVRPLVSLSLPISISLFVFFFSNTDAYTLIMIYLCRITYANVKIPVDAKDTEYYNVQNMAGKQIIIINETVL